MTEQRSLVKELRDEADLCRNETANDIAVLLDQAADTIEQLLGIDKSLSPTSWARIVETLTDEQCRIFESMQQQLDVARDGHYNDLHQVQD